MGKILLDNVVISHYHWRMDELIQRMSRCEMGDVTRRIIPLPDEIRSMIMERVAYRIRTVNDLICYNDTFMTPMNYYIYEQVYCSISSAIRTDELDEIVIVLARTPQEANEYMGRFVKFYEYDCPVCVPRWLPQYEGDEADILLEKRTRLRGKRIKAHIGGQHVPLNPLA